MAPARRMPAREGITMDQGSSAHLYRDYVISTLHDEGVWWATAAPAGRSLDTKRRVPGGPWTIEGDAVRAAEAFCNSGRVE